jgi:hypothetical protein
MRNLQKGKMMVLSFDTIVRGGMPVEINFEIGQPEHDVGIFTPYIKDIWLEVRGKRAKWLEDHLSLIEWENLEEEVLKNYSEGHL